MEISILILYLSSWWCCRGAAGHAASFLRRPGGRPTSELDEEGASARGGGAGRGAPWRVGQGREAVSPAADGRSGATREPTAAAAARRDAAPAGSGCVSPCLVLSVVRKHTFCRCRCIAGDSQHQEMQTITSNLACACIWTEAPNMSPPQLWWDTTRDDWNAKESIISQLRSGTCHNTKQDKSESFFY
jgi:hypothetical protein